MMATCSQQLRKAIFSQPKYLEIYNRISPVLFDTSLRDGLQNANVENFPTTRKMLIFNHIKNNEKPQSMEIGSLSSPKILPIMKDTLELYKQMIEEYEKNPCNNPPCLVQNGKPLKNNDDCREHCTKNPVKTPIFSYPKLYVLIPSISKLELAIQNNIQHMSFITSVSNAFHLKNTNRTISDTKNEFQEIFKVLGRELDKKYTKKLYISCINECPIVGKIDNDVVVNDILYYNIHYDFDELCLSDTCGTLDYEDFVYIIETIHFFGIPKSKFSLHLHMNPAKLDQLEFILRYCFRNDITKFDISLLETGGCSVTMSSKKLLPNLSYDMFYRILYKHISAVVSYSE